MLACLWFGLYAIWLGIRDRSRLRAHLGDLDNLIVIVACASTFVLAIGEIEEEARFVVSLLPLLASVPHVYRVLAWIRERKDRMQRRSGDGVAG